MQLGYGVRLILSVYYYICYMHTADLRFMGIIMAYRLLLKLLIVYLYHTSSRPDPLACVTSECTVGYLDFESTCSILMYGLKLWQSLQSYLYGVR